MASCSLPSTSKDVLTLTNALRVQLETKEFSQQQSTRVNHAKEIGQQLLLHSNSEKVHYINFCEDIVSVLEACFDTVKKCTCMSTKEDRLWNAYYKAATNEVPSLWKLTVVFSCRHE